MSILDAFNQAMENDPNYIAANDPNNPRYAEFDKAVKSQMEKGIDTTGPILDDDQSLIEKSIQMADEAKQIEIVRVDFQTHRDLNTHETSVEAEIVTENLILSVVKGGKFSPNGKAVNLVQARRLVDGEDVGEDVTENIGWIELNDVVTAAEAAKALGLAEATVRQAINRKQIPARKSAGTWLILRKDAVARWSKKS